MKTDQLTKKHIILKPKIYRLISINRSVIYLKNINKNKGRKRAKKPRFMPKGFTGKVRGIGTMRYKNFRYSNV